METTPAIKDASNDGKFHFWEAGKNFLGGVYDSTLGIIENAIKNPKEFFTGVALTVGAVLATAAVTGLTVATVGTGLLILGGAWALYTTAKGVINVIRHNVNGDGDAAERAAKEAGKGVGQLAMTALGMRYMTKAAGGNVADDAANAAKDSGNMAKVGAWFKDTFGFKGVWNNTKEAAIKAGDDIGTVMVSRHPGTAQNILDNNQKIARSLKIEQSRIQATRDLKTAQTDVSKAQAKVASLTDEVNALIGNRGVSAKRAELKNAITELRSAITELRSTEARLTTAETAASSRGVQVPGHKTNYDLEQARLRQRAAKEDAAGNNSKASDLTDQANNLKPGDALRNEAAALRKNSNNNKGFFKRNWDAAKANRLERKANHLDRTPGAFQTLAYDPTKTGLSRLENLAIAATPAVVYGGLKEDNIPQSQQIVLPAQNPYPAAPASTPASRAYNALTSDVDLQRLAAIDPAGAKYLLDNGWVG